MDIDSIKFLTDEQKERYMKLERLFRSEGWELIQEWATTQRAISTNRVLAATTWEQNRVFTGAREAFTLLESLREATEAEFEALAAQQSEAVAIEDETRFE